MWSTDTTATVFGYLDTDDQRAKSRVQSARPGIQAPSQKAKRKPMPARGLLGEYIKARFAERIEQCSCDTVEDEAGDSTRSMQERRDEQRIEIESDWSGAKRGRTRMVSKDDQLVERGANPRTGLVSPFVVSENSEECLGDDYIAVGKVGSTGPAQRRTCSGKWKQDSLGWSLVESPVLSPIAQSMSDKMSRTISIKQLEDRLLVEMPGWDNPNPENMTDGEIKKYQERFARAYRRGGGSLAMLDLDTLLSPRQWTPEGPSTPPTKMQKIHRKEVGSGVVRKSNSDDTVIINADNRAYSQPTPRKDTVEREKVKIITPSNTPKGSSFESCADISDAMRNTDPFLGRGSRMTCNQTASAAQSHMNTEQAHQCLQNESKSSPSSALSDPPPASPILSHYLPRLQFLHPSHFANLETSSYRRPTQVFPARLRSLGPQRQAVGDVGTTTSTKGPRLEQRPEMHRQKGNRVVPKANLLSPECETPIGGYRQSSTPRDKQYYPNTTPVNILHTSGSVTGRSQAIGPTEKINPARDSAETRSRRKDNNARRPQAPCENRRRNLASPTHTIQGLRLGSANVARERIQLSENGDGCTPTYDHLGRESRAVPGVGLQCIADDKEHAAMPAEFTVGSDTRAWFTGQWAEVEEDGEPPDLATLTQEETLARKRSVLRKAADMKLLLYAAEAWVEPLAKLDFIWQLLHQMICHIMSTLHPASPALTTLRTANVTTRDRFRAMKNIALAAGYLLVLLNSFMIVRRVLGFVSKVLYCPVQTILVIIGWFMLG